MTEAPKLLLAHHLKTLKLPTFLREYDKVAQQCAAEGLDHVQFLARLVELELIDRERRMIERRIKAAKFPAVKSLDSFDFKAIPSLNKMQVLELARCEWIERRENVIALGPSGTGKTHVALGLGLAACQKGLAVGFTTAAALVHELMEARDERRLLRLQKQMVSHKLLIIDELGFVPLSKTGAELLFELISQRYERGATLITSNLPFDEWTETFGSERLTGALLDRLTHHVSILEMNGDSYRLGQSRARKARRQRLTPEKRLALTGQSALARASYMESARAKALTPPNHHFQHPEVAEFCAATWLVFPPPLTSVGAAGWKYYGAFDSDTGHLARDPFFIADTLPGPGRRQRMRGGNAGPVCYGSRRRPLVRSTRSMSWPSSNSRRLMSPRRSSASCSGSGPV